MSSMSPLDDSGEEIFDKLKREPEIQEQARAEEVYNAKIRARFSELIASNSNLPVTISSIRIIGAARTRRSFLDRIFNPLLSVNNDEPYTLQEALSKISASTDRLSRFGIFRDPIFLFLDKPDPTDPSSTPTDINVYLRAQELGLIRAKTGTEIGNVEGGAYGNVLLRNIFGGAESFDLNASYGTRTRNAYHATFQTPLNSDPDLTLSLDGLKSSVQKPWASHEELLRGFGTRLRWATPYLPDGFPNPDPRIGNSHEIGYTGSWRQITKLASDASPTVRSDAGDSSKSSLSHTWTNDTRDHAYIPTTGRLIKTVNELAGFGPLGGDVGFLKSEFEFSFGRQLSNPFSTPSKTPNFTGYSITTGFRTGVLFPLPVGGSPSAFPSRINDRFQLGGPTDVRGFRQGGIGPRDGSDALGGDIYAAGSLNFLMPIPRVAPENPLRLQFFINGGRLVALGDTGKEGVKQGWSQRDALKKVNDGVKEIFLGGYPSLAAGVGLVYVHPAARFELNFSLPVVSRKAEESRKGLQFGVGIDFL